MEPDAAAPAPPAGGGEEELPPLAESFAALLAYCADCSYPRQAADLASVSDLVGLCCAVQVAAESSPAYLAAQFAPAPRRQRLLARLAFWLATFPGADNVVAAIAILCYMAALTPGGACALGDAPMPAESPEDAAAPCADARARLLLPRLLYSVTRTAGRVAPANGMLSAARAASLCRLLAGEALRGARGEAPHAHGAAAAALRLRALLLHGSTLGALARLCALYASRPGPRDPLTLVRAATEAGAALLDICAAGAAGDEAAGEPCASPLRVAGACAEALRGGLGGACLSPPAAAALLEALRNAAVSLPRGLDALFSRLGALAPGGDAELGGPEAYFLVGGWGGRERGEGWALGSLEDDSGGGAPRQSRAVLVSYCRAVVQRCRRVLCALTQCQGVEALLAAPPPQQPLPRSPAPFAHPPCPVVTEHLLCAFFNLCASSSLRCALATDWGLEEQWGGGSGGSEEGQEGGARCCGGDGGSSSAPLGQALATMHRVACAAAARWGYLGEGGASPGAAALRAVEAALRVLECPLAGNGLLSGAALAGLFFGAGGGQLLASLLQEWARAPASALAALEPCVLRAARVLAAHLEYPEAALGPAGCVAGALRALREYFSASLAARPCWDARDARYCALAAVAARAANAPRDAWGGVARGGGGGGGGGAGAPAPLDLPGSEWGACAAQLMEALDDAVEAANAPPAAAAAPEVVHAASA